MTPSEKKIDHAAAFGYNAKASLKDISCSNFVAVFASSPISSMLAEAIMPASCLWSSTSGIPMVSINSASQVCESQREKHRRRARKVVYKRQLGHQLGTKLYRFAIRSGKRSLSDGSRPCPSNGAALASTLKSRG